MTSRFINEINLFPTTVWAFYYEGFDEYKDQFYQYFDREDVWLSNESYNNLTYTRANLHKELPLEPLTSFVQHSLEDVMVKCGYVKHIGITSMWATLQSKGGFHPQHVHRNSYLSCVFYMRDDSGKAAGTTFHNFNHNLHQIQPAADLNKDQIIKMFATSGFKPGTLLVFPSWLPHSTLPSQTDGRLTVSINSMPIGMTNMHHYDRYNFSDPSIMELKEYGPLTFI